jgi:hypothetical protein
MNRVNYKEHFEILELPIDASHGDVKKAYLLLKDLYSKDCLAIMSMQDEISAVQREDVLRQLKTAYLALSELFNKEQNIVVEFVEQIVADIDEYDGATLKKIRTKLDISLDDMAMETRVQYKHLVNIEEDDFGALPVAVYTRGFVANYAKFISLDPEVVAKSYMKNFRRYHEEI